jgi:hypothetical protein
MLRDEAQPDGGGMIKRVPTCPAVLSIIGWHAGESPDIIINRKRADI